jgi:RNA 3'-terminal phosphate cyclase (ATP)
MITIDGSRGEGGGQILRTSLALSMITGTPFRIANIRAGRNKPGLLRQHLTGVRAATRISGAEVTGDVLRSQELTFRPGPVQAGEYAFAVGTAGSAGLVLQTVLPALLGAGAASTLELSGGTHNPASPPAGFLQRTFLPLLAQMGAPVEIELQRHGFYPAGGGRYAVRVPESSLRPIELLDRGDVHRIHVVAAVSNLPKRIAHRELKAVSDALGLDRRAGEVREVPSDGPGNVVWAEVETDTLTAVFTAYGRKGVSAENVAGELADEVRSWLDRGLPVGEHLADQLLIPMALAGGGVFRTGPPSGHLRTNIETVQRFLDVPIALTEEEQGVRVEVG